MDDGDKFLAILLAALLGVCVILASTGVWRNEVECISYWDGTKYTCEP